MRILGLVHASYSYYPLLQLSVLVFKCIKAAFSGLGPSTEGPKPPRDNNVMTIEPKDGPLIPVVGFVIHSCLQAASVWHLSAKGEYSTHMSHSRPAVQQRSILEHSHCVHTISQRREPGGPLGGLAGAACGRRFHTGRRRPRLLPTRARQWAREATAVPIAIG